MDKEENILFIGRLAEYKYYNMDAVIEKALDLAEKIQTQRRLKDAEF